MLAGSALSAPTQRVHTPLTANDFPEIHDEGMPFVLGGMSQFEEPMEAPALPTPAPVPETPSGGYVAKLMKKDAPATKKASAKTTKSKSATRKSADQTQRKEDGSVLHELGSPLEKPDVKAMHDSMESESSRDETWRKLVISSWQELKKLESGEKEKEAELEEETRAQAAAATSKAAGSDGASKSGWRFWNRGSKDNSHSGKEHNQKTGTDKKGNNNEKTFDVPQTFEEMCILNANMIGIDVEFVKIVQQCFERLIAAVAQNDDARLELESNIMSLRFHKDVKTQINPKSFQTVMLASLRSLLPKIWSIAHENAWITMWEMITGFLHTSLGLPKKYEKAVDLMMQEMDGDEHKDFGIGAFNRLFDAFPQSESYFKASNARLNFLAGKALYLATQMYKEPTGVLNETMGLGLRHIMYNVSVEFFAGFVTALVEELKVHTNDEMAIEGVEYTLTLIATTMVNTINEGQNPLLRAIAVNSPSGVKKALGALSRQDRAGRYL